MAAYWAGLRFDKHYFSEVDDYAVKVYQKRFPDAEPLGDIRDVDYEKLPKGEWLVTGGFPCQDVSIAGKGAGLEGSRSGLWYEYARIIGDIRPRIAVIENVGALVVRGLDRVLCSLAEIGYDAVWQDIRASDLGAPHRRERIWIVAYANNTGNRASRYGNDQQWAAENKKQEGQPQLESCRYSEAVAHAEFTGLEGRIGPTGQQEIAEFGNDGAFCNSASERLQDRASLKVAGQKEEPEFKRSNGGLSNTGDSRAIEWQRECREDQPIAQGREDNRGRAKVNEIGEWWKIEPAFCELVAGLPASLGGYEGRLSSKSFERVNQLKALGNAIVPQVAELIMNMPAFDIWRKING